MSSNHFTFIFRWVSERTFLRSIAYPFVPVQMLIQLNIWYGFALNFVDILRLTGGWLSAYSICCLCDLCMWAFIFRFWNIQSIDEMRMNYKRALQAMRQGIQGKWKMVRFTIHWYYGFDVIFNQFRFCRTGIFYKHFCFVSAIWSLFYIFHRFHFTNTCLACRLTWTRTQTHSMIGDLPCYVHWINYYYHYWNINHHNAVILMEIHVFFILNFEYFKSKTDYAFRRKTDIVQFRWDSNFGTHVWVPLCVCVWMRNLRNCSHVIFVFITKTYQVKIEN